MTEFEVGDKVIVAAGAGWYDSNGLGLYRSAVKPGLAEVIEEFREDTYNLSQNGEGPFSVHAKFLTLAVDEPYTFDPGGEVIEYSDIKVGDTIAAITCGTWRIGEVRSVEHYAVSNSTQAYLAYSDTDTTEIRLLHRPMLSAWARSRSLQCARSSAIFCTALVKAGVTVNV